MKGPGRCGYCLVNEAVPETGDTQYPNNSEPDNVLWVIPIITVTTL